MSGLEGYGSELVPHPALDAGEEAPHEGPIAPGLGRNVAVTMAARVGYMITRIGIPPFVLAHMPLEAYGIWQTAFILVNYLGISTMGVSNVYIKFVAEYAARRQFGRANELLSTGLTVTIPACTTLFAVTTVLWPWLAAHLHLSAGQAAESREAVLVVVGVFLVSIALSAFQDALTGVQEIALTQGFWVAGYVLEMVLIYVLVGRGRGIRGMAEAYLARTVLTISLSIVWSFRRLPWLRLSPARFSRTALANVFHFGGVVQVQTLLSTMINSVERVAAIGLGMGVAPVAVFDLGKKWPSSVATVPMSFFNAFLPAASHLQAGDARAGAVRALYVSGARQANLISGYFCGLMALLPWPIMAVWLGPTLKQAPGAVALFALFSVATQVHLLTGPGTSILRGVGRIYEEFWYLLPNIVWIVVTLGISRWIVGGWTVLGVGSAVCTATGLSAMIFLSRAHRVLGVSLAIYLREVIGPGLLPYVVAFCFAYPVTLGVRSAGRWGGAGILLIAGMLYSLVLLFVLDGLVLSKNEKQRWRDLCKRGVALGRR